MIKRIAFVFLALIFVAGCAGEPRHYRMRDNTGASRIVEFPRGTITGAASKEQADTLAEVSIESHNMTLDELDKLKDTGSKSLENQETLKKSTQRIEATGQRIEDNTVKLLDLSEKNAESARMTIKMIEQLSKRHGTGEITIFFPTGSSKIKNNSTEYRRLVNFTDFLSRASKGRKVLLVAIGSASATGSAEKNRKLAMDRANASSSLIRKYLVNVPHQFFKMYGTGDIYSPRDLSKDENMKYQHARIIAFYEHDQIPGLPLEHAGEK